ncbi:hypothetical protein GCM10027053_47400 [Intrasporangium mesophilum]
MRSLISVVLSTMRPPVLLLLVMYATTGLFVTGEIGALPVARALLVVVPFLTYSALINDLSDQRIDQVNLPGDARRMYAAGTAHRATLIGVALGSLAVGGCAAVAIAPAALVVLAAGVLVSTAYSIGPVRLADRGIVAAVALPACYVATPYFVGVVTGRGVVRIADLPLLAALYVTFVGRIILKDFRDVRGDALFGKRTFVVRHGRVATCVVSATCWVVGTAMAAALSPSRSVTHTTSLALGALGALVLLRELAREQNPRREAWIISALAIVGRGQLLVVILGLGLTAVAASAGHEPLVMALTVLSFGLQARVMAQTGPGLAARPTALTQWRARPRSRAAHSAGR